MESKDAEFLDGVCDLGERLLGEEPNRVRVAALLVFAARKVLTDGGVVDEGAFELAMEVASVVGDRAEAVPRKDLN